MSQLKNILQDMKRGYSIVSDGYRKVKNIAEGNFSLHEVFLDGLMVVSPEVKKYRRVADIISAQKAIVSEYRKSFKRLASADVLGSGELEYISRVYAGIFQGSMDNLDELAMVITSSRLRMDDQQRLEAIDRVFQDISGKLEFLRAFNRDASVLLELRKREAAGVKSVQDLFGN
ncbi:MAG: TerB family tellurite resistance protein [Chitinophagaceae bacterium]|nr:MAG: TerB family tellurite resistance protein [Chitinophagaceae bacterium]